MRKSGIKKTGIILLSACVLFNSMILLATASENPSEEVVSEVISEEDSETSEEVSEDISEKESEEASEETSEKSSEEASEETSEKNSDKSSEVTSEDASEDTSEEDEISSEEMSDAEEEGDELGASQRITNLQWHKEGYVTFTYGTSNYNWESIRVSYEGMEVYTSSAELKNNTTQHIQCAFNESGTYKVQIYQFTSNVHSYDRKDLSCEIEVQYTRTASEIARPTNLHWEKDSFGPNFVCFNGSANARSYIIRGYNNGYNNWSSYTNSNATRYDQYRQNYGSPNYFTVQAVSSDLSKWANSKPAYWNSKSIFKDVPANAWYTDAVLYATYRNIMNGTGDGSTFSPNGNITRAQLAMVLYSCDYRPAVSAQNPFKDVKAGQWYTSAVLWANDKGIAKGHAATGGGMEFGVNNPITRQDLAVMLYSYAKYRNYTALDASGYVNKFKDGKSVSNYAKPAMGWFAAIGVISGKGKSGAPESELRLDPAGYATRAECAAIIKKFREWYYVER